MPRPHEVRRGFSFVEILFAIFVLGIGFIMIAAIFPVAITQTQAAAEQSTGRAVAEGAKVQLEWAFKKFKASVPDTASEVRDLSDAGPLFTAIDGSRIVSADRRFGWVALYKYDEAINDLMIWVIAVQVRNKSEFDDGDIRGLDAIRTTVKLEDFSATGADQITFTQKEGQDRAAEGAYIVRADGTGLPMRLGSPVDQAAGIWELIHTGDADITGTENNVSVMIVGRGPDDYTQDNSPNRVGAAQDAYLLGPYKFSP
jgi:hypothetical protein